MFDHIIGALIAFAEKFKRVMIDGNRYEFILDGLKNTFTITFGALAIGVGNLSPVFNVGFVLSVTCACILVEGGVFPPLMGMAV